MSVKIVFSDIDDFTHFISNVTCNTPNFGPLISALIRAADQPDTDAADSADNADAGDSAANIITNYGALQPGDRVRWEGRTIQSDGEVISVDSGENDDGTVVRIRRDDTGKVFKITFDQGPTYGKMYRL